MNLQREREVQQAMVAPAPADRGAALQLFADLLEGDPAMISERCRLLLPPEAAGRAQRTRGLDSVGAHAPDFASTGEARRCKVKTINGTALQSPDAAGPSAREGNLEQLVLDATYPRELEIQFPRPRLPEQGWARVPNSPKVAPPEEVDEFLQERWKEHYKTKVHPAQLRKDLVDQIPNQEELHLNETDVFTLMKRYLDRTGTAKRNAKTAADAAAAA